MRKSSLVCQAGLLLCAGALGMAAVPVTLAQGVLEEIVVSAQKREQNIQDVGIAISAFSGAQLEALGVQESFDVASFTYMEIGRASCRERV